ncbi:MAG: glycosyltransferase family 2 protein [Acidimicrobiales bacterium]|jgi:hypothetical protein
MTQEPSVANAQRSPARVGALVVAWRSLGLTLDTLQSIRQSTFPVEPIICVAQEYSREDLGALKRCMVGQHLMIEDRNLGFAMSVNLGMEYAIECGLDWVLLVNNDATIDPDCVARCLMEAEHSGRIALLAPAVAYAHNPSKLWYAGGTYIDLLGIAWNRGRFLNALGPPVSSDCDHAPACCVLISTKAWREVGPFREDFFMYYEDTDWCVRARERGWRIRYVGSVLCQHVMAGSSGQHGSRYLSERTGYYLSRNPLRHALESSGIRRLTRTLAMLTIWNAYNLTRIRPADWSSVGRSCLAGLRDGWTGRMGPRRFNS